MYLRGSALLLIGLATGCTTVQPGVDSPEAVTRLLEQQWPPERIQAFCQPDTEMPPIWQLMPPDGTAWRGQLHKTHEREIGRVYWYRSNGREISLLASKGNGSWLLEYDVPNLTNAIPSREQDAISRIQLGLERALRFPACAGWYFEPPITNEEEHTRLSMLVSQPKEVALVELDTRGRPTRYEESGKEGRLAVEFENGAPKRFWVNDTLSEALKEHYRVWLEDRADWRMWNGDAERLRCVVQACVEYAYEHGNRLPDDWRVFSIGKNVRRTDFISVTQRKTGGKIRDVMQWTDFVYFPGHKLTDPPDTILAASPPKNYQVRRAIIATLDGEVELISPEEYEAATKKQGP